MARQKSAFIHVDELMPQIGLEQAAEFYGVALPELKRTGEETRLRCFLLCGKAEETGDRALSIRLNDPAKTWRCHQYGCGKGGNLIGLCDLMKPGQNAEGRPRGERFKAIAADLAAMVRGQTAEALETERPAAPPSPPAEPPKFNRPLAESDNPRARELVHLDEQFVTDPAEMPPAASAYFRRRPFLTPEACRRWQVGYLPHSSKSLLRGKIVYAYHSPQGELLTWFGRDPRYEQKQAQWKAGDRSEPEPVKTQFVKGFHRGLELYGEHFVRGHEAAGLQLRPHVGLLIVEGPNDAINLHDLGLPAVALCSNTITKDQVHRVATLARDLATDVVTLMLDTDEEGTAGTKQALPLLAEHVPVRIAWTPSAGAGKLKNRQPESLTEIASRRV